MRSSHRPAISGENISEEEDFNRATRAHSLRFSTWLTEIEVLKRPIVPPYAIHEYNRIAATALQYSLEEQQCVELRSAKRHLDVDNLEGVHIDYSPDVDLGIFEVQFGLVDCNRRMVVKLGSKQIRQSMILLAHSLV
ncbi:hypothetical protein [Halopenitus persicus]|uniref:Uncharacterized protein n=1 Tax=Halopenitus persicus TaxID=1048396 RepID=A0A1H3NIR9_9EURY|nr:hypothetical protein [Halopenitus persicus]SDY88782.1 hypothetical protein SAMN05216564_11316 [Halopenitus persicus]